MIEFEIISGWELERFRSSVKKYVNDGWTVQNFTTTARSGSAYVTHYAYLMRETKNG